MALMEITEFPERVLKEAGAPVVKFDGELAKLVADMFETMYAAEGVGLAAPQVGLSLRLFVMDCEGVKLVAANPEILSAGGEQEGEEGCLSVGKIHAPLKRAARAGRTRALVRARGRGARRALPPPRDRPLRRPPLHRPPLAAPPRHGQAPLPEDEEV